MPKRLTVIGSAFCVVGALSAWDAMREFAQGGISLGLLFWLCLPVGIGLLRAKPSARRWARWLVACGYIVCALTILVALADAGDLYSPRAQGEAARLPFVVGAVIIAASLYVTQRLLQAQCVTDYLERPKPPANASGDASVDEVRS